MKTPELRISHNPFTLTTYLELNGEEINSGRLADIVRNRRLSQWIDQFIVLVFDEINTSEIRIHYTGTSFDADDIRSAISMFKDNNPKTDIYSEFHEDTSSVDERVGKLRVLVTDAKNGPIEEFRSDKMSQIFEGALAPEFEVYVVATMSSGKSTFINSILGLELMPARNTACTATIAKISDCKDMDEFKGRRLDDKKNILDDWQEIALQKMQDWNEDKLTSTIEIRGNIHAINKRPGVTLVLNDTPGPNNSLDHSHKHTMIKAINGKKPSMILYVMDATKIGTEDDLSLLKLIQDVMAEGGRTAQDRFIFVLNRIDMIDTQKESIESVINKAKDFLNTNGIKYPLIVPVSAELTRLIRIVQLGGEHTLTDDEQDFFDAKVKRFFNKNELNMLEYIKNDIDGKTYKALSESINVHRLSQERLKTVEILSGIPIIEKLIDNYISKHAIPTRLQNAINEFEEITKIMEIKKKQEKLLNQGEKELDEILNAIKQFQHDSERIDKAREFREKIKAVAWSPSAEYKQIDQKINREVQVFLDTAHDDSDANMTKEKAIKHIDKLGRDADFLVLTWQESFINALENDTKNRLNELREEYVIHIEKLLQKKFPKGIMDIAFEFQKASLQMKNVQTILENSSYTEKERVGSSEVSDFIWYNPFSWWSKKTVPIYGNVEKTNMREVLGALDGELRRTIENTKEMFTNKSIDNLEKSKMLLLQEIELIDEKMDNNIAELERYHNNHLIKQENLLLIKESVDWYANFELALQNILSIKGITYE